MNSHISKGLSKAIVATGCLLLINFLLVNQLMGETIHVSSVAAMESQANSASAGDTIVLADGTYHNNTFNISGSNITVRAETPGGVYLNGSNHITISGDYIIFSGFQFTGGDIGDGKMLEVYGDHNKVTQCNWNGYSAKRYIDIKGGSQYNEVSYCNFEDKPADAALSALVHIRPHATIPGYHVIRYCSFQNLPGDGGDYGNEPLKIGSGGYYTNVSRTTVEFCYWNNTGLADSESISIKCRENTIRYNTFTNQQNAKLVFRNGDDNKAYGNFFIDAGGIRVKEASNIDVYNNYFENSGTASEDAVKYDYVKGGRSNLDDITFTNNTFVECEGRIDIDICGENNTWNNNIFLKASGDIFKDVDSSISWDGNIYQGSLGATIASGMTNDDPELTLNADGYYGLSSTSPCIDAGVSIPAIQDITNVDDDPSLLLDISGQSRPSLESSKDIGCDEYTTGDITNRPLTLSDVGPGYLTGSDSNYLLTINGGAGSGKYTKDLNVTIEAKRAPSGFVFDTWIGDTSFVADAKLPKTNVIMPMQDITLTANFIRDSSFNLLTPINRKIGSNYLEIFTWESSKGADHYTLVIDDNIDFLSPHLSQTGIVNESYTMEGGQELTQNTSYYWKVDAYSDTTQTACNNVFYFTTESDIGTGVFKSNDNASSMISIFPNPGSRGVTLKYSLTERSRVFLAIYSLKGQLIKILVDNEMQTPKNYTSNFDVSDLKQGVYNVHLRTGSEKKSLMLIIK
jgi:hypothetical protein